ncbi:folylpolyglutamate synthase, mitochondrial-like [Brevipalpus obovatus]|uniref:folylpolyglutamate synthase, mitochondrial-like n=1 Tax=Brevipalpus obovatus TaxID=246614 RepID=UPI003D9DFE76
MISRCRIAFRLGRAYYCETRAMQQHFVNDTLLEPDSKPIMKDCIQSKSLVNGLSKSYDETIRALTQLESNSSILDKSANKTPDVLRKKADRLIDYLEKFSITLDDLNRLNIIHVAGTKGKGSTCAFVETILRQKGYKTGLFTSPHLITVRERIKINGKPISIEKFCENFWTMHDKLAGSRMPGFFMFTTLMGFYHFIKEQVDVLILETGLGGEFDCTNIVTKPIVVGISSLGMDHMNVLGDSLKSIAWHKAGIMKSHAIGVTVPQNPIAMEVIKERSIEKACPIFLSQPKDSLDSIVLGIEGNVQKINASLAIDLSRLWQNKVTGSTNEILSDFHNLQSKPLDEDELTALKQTKWPGRCQLVRTKFIDFFLDGAHTEESMENCLDWFNSKSHSESHQTSGRTIRGLLFSNTGKRQYAPLLKIIAKEHFDFAIFAPPRIDQSGQYEEMKDWRLDKDDMREKFKTMQNYWDDLNSTNGMKVVKSHHCNTLLQSMELLESPQMLLNEKFLPLTKEDRLHVLVSGSLLLVGRVMKIIESCPINFST